MSMAAPGAAALSGTIAAMRPLTMLSPCSCSKTSGSAGDDQAAGRRSRQQGRWVWLATPRVASLGAAQLARKQEGRWARCFSKGGANEAWIAWVSGGWHSRLRAVSLAAWVSNGQNERSLMPSSALRTTIRRRAVIICVWLKHLTLAREVWNAMHKSTSYKLRVLATSRALKK